MKPELQHHAECLGAIRRLLVSVRRRLEQYDETEIARRLAGINLRLARVEQSIRDASQRPPARTPVA